LNGILQTSYRKYYGRNASLPRRREIIRVWLKETYPDMANSDICEYLAHAIEISGGGVDAGQLAALVGEAG
jgi:hypothetical protein